MLEFYRNQGRRHVCSPYTNNITRQGLYIGYPVIAPIMSPILNFMLTKTLFLRRY